MRQSDLFTKTRKEAPKDEVAKNASLLIRAGYIHKEMAGVYSYQIQTKFRNEARAKSGILRGREFLMKDLYSFSSDEESHNEFYGKVMKSYDKIFEMVGLGGITYRTFASGGSFSKFSHEFQ